MLLAFHDKYYWNCKMKLKHFIHVVCFIALIISMYEADAQYSRRMTRGHIGWYNSFTTFSITPKTGLHFEYQWRRDDYVFNWQQSLLRTGVNFAPNPRVMFRLGYAWIETFNYGEIPLNSLGRDFTEHRIFEMVQLSQKEGRFDFSHRFMAEQRFVGRYNKIDSPREDEYPLLNRIRYMFRIQCPLKGNEIIDKTPYVAFYDEVMIGLGKTWQPMFLTKIALGC